MGTRVILSVGIVSCSIILFFSIPVCPFSLTGAQAASVQSSPSIILFTSAPNPVHSVLTIAAIVLGDNSSPVTSAFVNFKILSGPNAGLTGNSTTSAKSLYLSCPSFDIATFNYSSSTPGTDLVQANTVVNGIAVSTSENFAWMSTNSSITLSSSSIQPGQSLDLQLNGLAANWIPYPPDTICGPKGGHVTFVTVYDGSGDIFQFSSPLEYYQNGLMGHQIKMQITSSGGCYQVSFPGSNFSITNAIGCLNYGNIIMTVSTPDYIDQVIAPAPFGGAGGSIVNVNTIGRYANTEFQLVQPSLSFPEILIAALGIILVISIILIAIYVYSKRSRVKRSYSIQVKKESGESGSSHQNHLTDLNSIYSSSG